MSEHVKLRFEVDGSTSEEFEVESLWALKRDYGLELDNIPFYARGVALGDVVASRTDAEGALWFDGLIKASGHSTIRIWFTREEDVQPTRAALHALGCDSEVSNLPRLVAVDIPPAVPYDRVKTLLDEGETSGLFEYEEGCLGLRR